MLWSFQKNCFCSPASESWSRYVKINSNNGTTITQKISLTALQPCGIGMGIHWHVAYQDSEIQNYAIETEEVWGLLEDWTTRCDISLKCKSNTVCDIVTYSLELLKKERMGSKTLQNSNTLCLRTSIGENQHFWCDEFRWISSNSYTGSNFLPVTVRISQSLVI